MMKMITIQARSSAWSTTRPPRASTAGWCQGYGNAKSTMTNIAINTTTNNNNNNNINNNTNTNDNNNIRNTNTNDTNTITVSNVTSTAGWCQGVANTCAYS